MTYLDNVYTPEAITRSGPEVSSEYKKANLTLEMPAAAAVCSRYRIYVPATTTWLRIFRGHRDAVTGVLDPALTQAYWVGRVRDVRFKGAEAEVLCDPLDAMLDRICLRYQYQTGCNHALYGTQCGIDRNLFMMPATVTAISDSDITISAAALNVSPTNGVNWFLVGEVVAQDGDRRMILAQTSLTATTAKVSVGLPMENLKIGDVVNLYAGCDRSIKTCRTKFNNALRNGGFSKIPGTNVFQFGLPPAIQ